MMRNKKLTDYWFLIALVVIFLSSRVCDAVDFTRVELTRISEKAVCNDGSPATYFFRRGTGTGANIWVIYLEGGGYCFDPENCKYRNMSQPHLMTSKLLPRTLNDSTVSLDVNHGGIMSSNAEYNPHFYNANQIYLWYCTSDTYAGDRAASNATFGWSFNGHNVITSLIADLIKNTNPSLQTAKHVLLTGYSAGGIGTGNNADLVGQLVKAATPGVNYKAYVDSGWIPDLPPYIGDADESRMVLSSLQKNWNLQLDESCVAQYSQINQPWRCLYADYLVPYLETPTFFAQHQFDTPFLGGAVLPFNSSSLEYANIVKRTWITDQANLDGVFNPNCYAHGVEAFDNRWTVIKVQGVSASTAVWQWFTNAVPVSRYIETCQPVACTPNCPKI